MDPVGRLACISTCASCKYVSDVVDGARGAAEDHRYNMLRTLYVTGCGADEMCVRQFSKHERASRSHAKTG